MYQTPEPKEFSFAEIKGATPLKHGSLYIRLEMHSEDMEQNNILRAADVVQGYETPGYLQENTNHPDIDEHEINRRKAIEQRNLQRELAIKRKKVLIELQNRERTIRDKLKLEEEDLRDRLADELTKKLQEDLDKRKKELEDAQRELEAELRRLQEEKDRMAVLKKKREEDKESVMNDKVRIGIRLKLEGLSGFNSNRKIKVVYGLFLDNEVLTDDLGELMVYETQRYNEIVVKEGEEDSKGKKINIKFENEEKEFVRNVQGLVSLNSSRKREVLLGFQVVEIIPKIRAGIEDVRDIDEEDPLKDLPLPTAEELVLKGWRFYPVAKTEKSLKQDLKDIKSGKKPSTKIGQSQTVFLYKPPLIRKPYEAKYLEETKIKMTYRYEIFEYDVDSLIYFADQRVKVVKQTKDTFEKVKKKKYDKIYKEAFIKNSERQYSDIPFTKGSGIDVYVDACRFLPDNVTVTKVVLFESDHREIYQL